MTSHQELAARAALTAQSRAMREETRKLNKWNERVAIRHAYISAVLTVVWFAATIQEGALYVAGRFIPWWGCIVTILLAGLFAARTVHYLWKAITISIRGATATLPPDR